MFKMKCFLLVFLITCSFALINATSGTKAQEKRNVTIEVSIITDFGLFKKWYGFYKGNGTEAIKGIYYMYSNVFRRVRERFWGVEMEGARFDLRFTNTHVPYKPENASYTENYQQNGTIDQNKSVNALEEFMTTHKFNSSDVNVLVTGYKLTGGVETFLNGSLLSDNQVTMVITEVGQHRTTDFLTRRLAEALGGFYDVDNKTIDEMKFIMTSNREEANFEHPDNIDKFSPNTLKSFETNFKNTTYRWEQDCPPEDKFDVYWCANTHPLGQTYPIHRQCKFMYGPNSTTCNDTMSAQYDICLRLGCTNPLKNNNCTFAGDQRAYDRTSCKDGHWCTGAKCVNDTRAPPNTTYDYYVRYP